MRVRENERQRALKLKEIKWEKQLQQLGVLERVIVLYVCPVNTFWIHSYIYICIYILY